MQPNYEIIDGQVRELHASSARQSFKPLAVLLPFVAAAAAAGPAFGLWAGDVAMFWLLAVAAVMVWMGLNVANGERMSDIFAVFAVAGLVGLALAIGSGGYLLPKVGIILAAIALMGLSKIARRGWEYA